MFDIRFGGLEVNEKGSVQNMADEILRSDELYEKILAHPDWRVVHGIKGENDRMLPLAFDYSETGLRFHWDATSTQFHKHAMCDEIISAVGDIDLAGFADPVEIAEFDADFSQASQCIRMSVDAEAGWIKIYTPGR